MYWDLLQASLFQIELYTFIEVAEKKKAFLFLPFQVNITNSKTRC